MKVLSSDTDASTMEWKGVGQKEQQQAQGANVRPPDPPDHNDEEESEVPLLAIAHIHVPTTTTTTTDQEASLLMPACFACAICNQTLKQAHTLSCACSVCQSCWKDYQATSYTPHQCPHCLQHVTTALACPAMDQAIYAVQQQSRKTPATSQRMQTILQDLESFDKDQNNHDDDEYDEEENDQTKKPSSESSLFRRRLQSSFRSLSSSDPDQDKNVESSAYKALERHERRIKMMNRPRPQYVRSASDGRLLSLSDERQQQHNNNKKKRSSSRRRNKSSSQQPSPRRKSSKSRKPSPHPKKKQLGLSSSHHSKSKERRDGTSDNINHKKKSPSKQFRGRKQNSSTDRKSKKKTSSRNRTIDSSDRLSKSDHELHATTTSAFMPIAPPPFLQEENDPQPIAKQSMSTVSTLTQRISVSSLSSLPKNHDDVDVDVDEFAEDDDDESVILANVDTDSETASLNDEAGNVQESEDEKDEPEVVEEYVYEMKQEDDEAGDIAKPSPANPKKKSKSLFKKSMKLLAAGVASLNTSNHGASIASKESKKKKKKMERMDSFRKPAAGKQPLEMRMASSPDPVSHRISEIARARQNSSSTDGEASKRQLMSRSQSVPDLMTSSKTKKDKSTYPKTTKVPLKEKLKKITSSPRSSGFQRLSLTSDNEQDRPRGSRPGLERNLSRRSMSRKYLAMASAEDKLLKRQQSLSSLPSARSSKSPRRQPKQQMPRRSSMRNMNVNDSSSTTGARRRSKSPRLVELVKTRSRRNLDQSMLQRRRSNRSLMESEDKSDVELNSLGELQS